MPDLFHHIITTHGRRPRACRTQANPFGRVLVITMTSAVALALTLGVSPLGWTAEPAAVTTVASILFVKGDVSVRVAGGDWQPAAAGQPLVPGTEVRVGPQSSAELAYDKAHTRVSRLDKEGVAVVEEAGTEGVRIRLKQGRLFNLVSPLQTGEHFIVQTPEAVASVRGTIFEGDHAPESGTKFAVFDQGDGQKHEIVTQPVDADGKPVGERQIIGEGMQAGVKDGKLSEPEPVPPEKQEQAAAALKEVEQHSHEGASDNNANKQGGGGSAPPPGGTPPTSGTSTSTGTPTAGSGTPGAPMTGTPAPSSTPMTGAPAPDGAPMTAGAPAAPGMSMTGGPPSMMTGTNPRMMPGTMPGTAPMMGPPSGLPGTPNTGGPPMGLTGGPGPMGRPGGPDSANPGMPRGPEGPAAMEQRQMKAMADFLGVKPEAMQQMSPTEIAGRMEAKAVQEMRFAYDQAMKASNGAAMEQIQGVFHDTIAAAHGPSPTGDAMMAISNDPGRMQGLGPAGSTMPGGSQLAGAPMTNGPMLGGGLAVTMAAPVALGPLGPMAGPMMGPSTAMGGFGLMSGSMGPASGASPMAGSAMDGMFGAGFGPANTTGGPMMTSGTGGFEPFGPVGVNQNSSGPVNGGGFVDPAGVFRDPLASQSIKQELQGYVAAQTSGNILVSSGSGAGGGTSTLSEVFDRFTLAYPNGLVLDTAHGTAHYDLGQDRALFRRSDGVFVEHAEAVVMESAFERFENNGHGIYREYNAYNASQFELVDRGTNPFDHFERMEVRYGIFRYGNDSSLHNLGRLLANEISGGVATGRAYFYTAADARRDLGAVPTATTFDHIDQLQETHAIHTLPPNLVDDHGRVQEPFDHWVQTGDGYHAIYRKDNGQENDVGTIAGHPERLPIDHYELRADGYHELRKLPDGTLQDAGVKTPP